MFMWCNNIRAEVMYCLEYKKKSSIMWSLLFIAGEILNLELDLQDILVDLRTVTEMPQ